MGKTRHPKSTCLPSAVQPYDRSAPTMREKTTKLDSFKERLGRLKKDKDSTIGRLAQMAFDLAQFGYEEEVVGLIEAHIMKARPECIIPAMRLINQLLQEEERNTRFREVLGTTLASIYAHAVMQPMPGQRKREIYRIRRSWSNVFTQPFLEMPDAAAHLAQNFGSQTKRSRGGSDGEDEDDDRGDHSYGQMRPHKLQTTEINRYTEYDYETAYWQGETPDYTPPLPLDDGNWGDTEEGDVVVTMSDTDAQFIEEAVLATFAELSAECDVRLDVVRKENADLSDARYSLAMELCEARMQLMDKIMEDDQFLERERQLLEMVSCLRKEKDDAMAQNAELLADIQTTNRRCAQAELEKIEMERLLVVAKEPHNRFQLEFARLTALLESEKSKVAKLERLVEASTCPKELMENDVEEGRSAGWNIHVHQAMRDLEMSDDTDNMVFLEGSERLHPSTAQKHVSFAEGFTMEALTTQMRKTTIPPFRT